jgi:hypothetical protein
MKIIGLMTRTACLVALAMAVSPLWLSAAAQQQAQKRIVVTIPTAMPAFHSPDGQKVSGVAAVVRFASAEKNDIIVLDSTNATPETLAVAINVLRRLRASDPNPVHDGMAVVDRFAPPTLDARYRGVLTAKLKELKAQPHAATGVVGPGIGRLGQGRRIGLTESEINP